MSEGSFDVTATSSLKVRWFLWKRDMGRCGICGQEVEFIEMDVDHITPRSQGGGDDLANLRAAHSWCNRSRGAGRVLALASPPPRTRLTPAHGALAAHRERRGWSRQQLARAAGITIQPINKVERGTGWKPQLRTVHLIAQALGVDPADVDEFRPALGLPPARAEPRADRDA